MTKNIAIGIDIGGSHISCAACHLTEKNSLWKLLLKVIWTTKEQLKLL